MCSLISVDLGLYMPSYKTVSVYWMKDLLAKRKKAIKAAQVQTLNVPQYESLSIKKMLDFAAPYVQIEDYFPDPREIPQLPRQVSQQVTCLRVRTTLLCVYSGSRTSATA